MAQHLLVPNAWRVTIFSALNVKVLYYLCAINLSACTGIPGCISLVTCSTPSDSICTNCILGTYLTGGRCERMHTLDPMLSLSVHTSTWLYLTCDLQYGEQFYLREMSCRNLFTKLSNWRSMREYVQF